jgi:tetratricopeptide (TPR) repeat protein
MNTAIIEAVNFMKKYKPVVRTDIFLPQSLEEFERSGGGDCNETSTYLMSLLNEIKRIKRYNLKINMALVLINENGEHTFHACLILSSPQLNNEWKRISKESILNFNELNENEIKNSVAIDLFSDKVIGVVPKSLMILNENEFIGMYYSDSAASAAYGRKYELAEKYFKMALKYDKNSPVTYYNMSRMYEWRNKFKKAEEYAKKAIELAPNWSYGYFAYSQALYWQHKYKGALEYLEKAKKVDPNFKYYEYKDLMLYYINAGLSKD